MAVSKDLFKQLLGRFASGVTVVTTKNNEGVHGVTVSAFSSLSMEPPLVLICIARTGSSHDMLLAGQRFVVNILSAKQASLAYKFANPDLDSQARFADENYHTTENGLPVFEANLAHIACRLINTFDGGDHTIFVGEIESGDFSEGEEPLVYYQGQFIEAV